MTDTNKLPESVITQRIVFPTDGRGPMVVDNNYVADNRPVQKQKPHKTKSQTRAAKTVSILSWVNLLFVILVWMMLALVSERWWLTAALSYLPRIPYLLPALLLVGAGAICSRRSIWVNLISIAIVLFAIMDCVVPMGNMLASPVDGPELTVVSCNVQRFEPRFASVVAEIGKCQPDIVILQEAPDSHPLLADYFADWHTIQEDEYWVGSRYPLRIVRRCRSEAFDRQTALQLEVTTPDGKIMLCNIHQTTARHGLVELGSKSLASGRGQRNVERHVLLREEEAYATSAFVHEIDPGIPLIVAGDFNMPSSSHIYQSAWSGLQNAFDTAGWGMGYTSPCSSHRLWPRNTPWLRIDHILTNDHWQVAESRIGSGNGSDHRLIVARLILKNRPSAE